MFAQRTGRSWHGSKTHDFVGISLEWGWPGYTRLTPSSSSPSRCFKLWHMEGKVAQCACSVFYIQAEELVFYQATRNTRKSKQRPRSQPAELFLAPSFSFSQVRIRNSALSAPVSIAVAACYKTCMENLLVEISQRLTAWLSNRPVFVPVGLWSPHEPSAVIHGRGNSETEKSIECKCNYSNAAANGLYI